MAGITGTAAATFLDLAIGQKRNASLQIYEPFTLSHLKPISHGERAAGRGRVAVVARRRHPQSTRARPPTYPRSFTRHLAPPTLPGLASVKKWGNSWRPAS